MQTKSIYQFYLNIKHNIKKEIKNYKPILNHSMNVSLYNMFRKEEKLEFMCNLRIFVIFKQIYLISQNLKMQAKE